MVIQEAAEMYLETIHVLSKKKGNVRSVDVAIEMGYSKPTISAMMKKLKENGYINMAENGYITLTKTGSEIAERIYERHNVISEIFVELGVDEKTAMEDACRVEHYISQKTFDCLKKYYMTHKGDCKKD